MREREAKLLAGEEFVIPGDVGTAMDGLVPVPVELREIHDTYHDTTDLRLARWGATLRRRRAEGWTVKVPLSSTDATLDRQEVDFADGAEPPVQALALVASLTRGAPVAEVARVRTRRTVRPWVAGGGQVVIELTDDEVDATSVDGRELRFREIEVELAPGAPGALLDAVVARLVSAGAVDGTPVPKAVRVLGERAGGPPDVVVPRLGARPSARKVIRVALATSVQRLVLNLPLARLGEDPEGVHQARVATRRLRSDLRTFGPLLDPDDTAALRRELGWLARELGVVRDADVLMAKLSALAAEHPEIDPIAAARIIARLRAEREASRSRLLDHLADERAMLLHDHLVAAATDPPTTAAARQPAVEVMARLVSTPWRRLRAAVHALDEDPAPAELHRVRLLAKRVRYAAEAVAPAVGRPAERFAAGARRIQDELGEVNDAVVAHHWLARAAGDTDGAFAFAAGQLAQQLIDGASEHRTAWRCTFERLDRPKATRWLG